MLFCFVQELFPLPGGAPLVGTGTSMTAACWGVTTAGVAAGELVGAFAVGVRVCGVGTDEPTGDDWAGVGVVLSSLCAMSANA